MDNPSESCGATVDVRLAPAGMTRLLGSYGAGRASILIAAGALIAGACGLRIFTDAPPVTVGLSFIMAVTLVASEFGTRAGLHAAGASIAAMTFVALAGWSGESAGTIVGRSAVLLFLAPSSGARSAAPRR